MPSCDASNTNWKPDTFSATVWVGNACPASCAIKAAKRHRNPKSYCNSVGSATTYKDGGCKLFYDW